MILTKNKNGQVAVRGEYFYKSDMGKDMSVMKRNNTIQRMNPIIVPPRVAKKKEKLEDVKKLLGKHFGRHWRNNPALLFYENVLYETELPEDDCDIHNTDLICEHHEETITLRI